MPNDLLCNDVSFLFCRENAFSPAAVPSILLMDVVQVRLTTPTFSLACVSVLLVPRFNL